MSLFKWIAGFFGSAQEEVKPVQDVSDIGIAQSKPMPSGAQQPAEPAPTPKLTKASLSKLTKAQLEAKGREFGIELDKRKKKDALVAEVLKASKK